MGLMVAQMVCQNMKILTKIFNQLNLNNCQLYLAMDLWYFKINIKFFQFFSKISEVKKFDAIGYCLI